MCVILCEEQKKKTNYVVLYRGGESMRVDRKKFMIAMARARLGVGELSEKAGVGKNTIFAIKKGSYDTMPKTAGLLAEALGVDVTEIMENEIEGGE